MSLALSARVLLAFVLAIQLIGVKCIPDDYYVEAEILVTAGEKPGEIQWSLSCEESQLDMQSESAPFPRVYDSYEYDESLWILGPPYKVTVSLYDNCDLYMEDGGYDGWNGAYFEMTWPGGSSGHLSLSTGRSEYTWFYIMPGPDPPPQPPTLPSTSQGIVPSASIQSLWMPR